MGNLIVYGILLAVLASAAGYVHHQIYASGEAAGAQQQLKADTPIVDGLKTQITEARQAQAARESEAAACKNAADAQSAAVADANSKALSARKLADQALTRMQAQQRDADARIADLRRKAAAQPQGDHDAQCVAAESVLRDTATRLRQQP